MADDLDQAVLLITAVMVPICLLPFLLARIETWLAAPQQTRTAKTTAKPTPEGARGFVRRAVVTTALWWGATDSRPDRRR